MGGVAGSTERLSERFATLTAKITRHHLRQLDDIVDKGIARSRSEAIRHLIDVHAGVVLEKMPDLPDPVKMPRPVMRWKEPALDAELVAYLAGIVRAVGLEDPAFDAAGVTEAQRTAWLRKGRADRDRNVESLEADLVAAIDRSAAEAEIDRVRKLDQDGSTAALKFLLERQHADRYGSRTAVDHEHRHSFIPAVDFSKLTLEETEIFVRLMRKMAPDADALTGKMKPAAELLPPDVLAVVEGEAQRREPPAPAKPKAPRLEAPPLVLDPATLPPLPAKAPPLDEKPGG